MQTVQRVVMASLIVAAGSLGARYLLADAAVPVVRTHTTALIGTWRLVEFWDRETPSSPLVYRYGQKPTGYFTYDPTGHVSIQIMRGPSTFRVDSARGEQWFETATPFEYFNDPQKTQEARSQDGAMSTVGDVGYLDPDGYLHLTDRATFMIISGGVNIYPQECENLLITHPKVADAAVFGVPNPDLGEEVKAVVQLMPDVPQNQKTAEELIAFCSQHLARQKVPRSIDFEAELPRLPTGKLYKRLLRDRYWGNKTSRIV